jgi:glutathione S-transferase
MQLYNANFSPNCLRVRAVIHELGLPVEITDVDVHGGGNRTPEFLKHNPNAKVPVLVDGDFTLWESRAINAYLAGLDPERRLYPEDAKARAIVDQWSYWQAIHLGPSSQRLTFERVLKKRFGRGEPNEELIATEMKETTKLLGVLDECLTGQRWVAGELSIADFALASTLTMRAEAGITLEELGNVRGWLDRLESREAWKEAMRPIVEAARR